MPSDAPRPDLTRIALHTPWFEVEELAVGHPLNPYAAPFYRIRERDGVLCLTLTEAGEFLLVRQFRPALERVTLEVPAGGIEAGETVIEAAGREIFEETGHRCDRILVLGSAQYYVNRFDNDIHLVLALGARPAPGWVAEAGIEVVTMPRAALRQLVAENGFAHAAALSAILTADIKFGCRLLEDPIEQLEARLRHATNPA